MRRKPFNRVEARRQVARLDSARRFLDILAR